MRGHTVSTYNDIMNNIPKLQKLYATSGLTVRPKTPQPKIEHFKLSIEA